MAELPTYADDATFVHVMLDQVRIAKETAAAMKLALENVTVGVCLHIDEIDILVRLKFDGKTLISVAP